MVFFQMGLPLTRFHFFHFFWHPGGVPKPVLARACIRASANGLLGMACISASANGLLARACIRTSTNGLRLQGVHQYISQWTAWQGVQHLRKPPKVISKIPKRSLQNPKKEPPKSRKSVSRTWKNESPVQVGCASTTSPNGLLVPFFKHKCAPKISKKEPPKSRKKSLQNPKKEPPKSKKRASKTSQSGKSIGRCTDAHPEGGVHSLMYGCTPWREVHSLMYRCTPWREVESPSRIFHNPSQNARKT